MSRREFNATKQKDPFRESWPKLLLLAAYTASMVAAAYGVGRALQEPAQNYIKERFLVSDQLAKDIGEVAGFWVGVNAFLTVASGPLLQGARMVLQKYSPPADNAEEQPLLGVGDNPEQLELVRLVPIKWLSKDAVIYGAKRLVDFSYRESMAVLIPALAQFAYVMMFSNQEMGDMSKTLDQISNETWAASKTFAVKVGVLMAFFNTGLNYDQWLEIPNQTAIAHIHIAQSIVNQQPNQQVPEIVVNGEGQEMDATNAAHRSSMNSNNSNF